MFSVSCRSSRVLSFVDDAVAVVILKTDGAISFCSSLVPMLGRVATRPAAPDGANGDGANRFIRSAAPRGISFEEDTPLGLLLPVPSTLLRRGVRVVESIRLCGCCGCCCGCCCAVLASDVVSAPESIPDGRVEEILILNHCGGSGSCSSSRGCTGGDVATTVVVAVVIVPIDPTAITSTATTPVGRSRLKVVKERVRDDAAPPPLPYVLLIPFHQPTAFGT
mmetsp:Transcript_33011/g.71438  ORF Transcript_33011/g.71438 Transcript_33011/m.71438 type:complete len:222 (-) Transcript_33011:612-1277(-)